MRLILLVISFICTALSSISCQSSDQENSVIDCIVDSSMISSTYVNDPCIVALNFLKWMERQDLDSALKWSEEQWFFDNLFEDFNNAQLDSLHLEEKKEIAELLLSTSSNLLADKRSYLPEDKRSNVSSSVLPISDSVVLVVEGNLGYAIVQDKVVYLQSDENKNWRAFKIEPYSVSRQPILQGNP